MFLTICERKREKQRRGGLNPNNLSKHFNLPSFSNQHKLDAPKHSLKIQKLPFLFTTLIQYLDWPRFPFYSGNCYSATTI